MFRKYIIPLLVIAPLTANAAEVSYLTDSSLNAPCSDGTTSFNCSNFFDYSDYVAPLPGLGWATVTGTRTDTSVVYSILPNTGALVPGENFGIQAVSFNFADVVPPFDWEALIGSGDLTISGIPDGWDVSYFKTEAGWGFDIGWKGEGSSRVQSLDITFASALSEVLDALQAGSITIHVADFTLNGSVENSAHFNGGFRASRDIPPPPVPLPAAAWLLGSGLLGFLAIGGRRNA